MYVNKNSLTKPVAVASAVSIALVAALVVSLLVGVFALVAKEAGAQSTSLAVKPTTVDFGDQAVGVNSEPVTVTISNTGSSPLTIGGATTGADAGSLKFVDPLTGLLVDTFTGLDIPGNTQKTLQVVLNPTQAGPVNAAITLINPTTNTIL